jgi:hypothetical protein
VFDPSKSLKDDLALIQNPNMFLFGDHYSVWPIHGMTRVEDILWIGPSQVMDQISTYYACYTNTVPNIDEPQQPGYQDWQWHSAAWITNQLGYQFYPLQNNQMRIYTEQDIDLGIDPLDPGFGPPGKPGAFHNKQM